MGEFALTRTIGIIGSRRRTDILDKNLAFKQAKLLYREGDEFVSGGCPVGGDTYCELIARELGAPIKIYHACWHRDGRRAGLIRNTFIAHDASHLIALVANDRSGGTEDTIRKFLHQYHHTEARAIAYGVLYLL